MDRKQLLDQIEATELERLNNLSNNALYKEVAEWFAEGNFSPASRQTLIHDYMEDYMRWQNDKSIDELLDMIN